MDLVVQQHEHTQAARRRARGRPHGVDQIQPGVAGERAGRPLRSDDDDRKADLQREIQEVGGLFEARGPVADDDAREIGMLGDERVAAAQESLPLGEVDGGARHVGESHGNDVGDHLQLGEARDDLVRVQHDAVGAVILQIERRLADRRDRATGSDEGDFREAHPSTIVSDAALCQV